MMYHDPYCRDCQALTNGDCGKHQQLQVYDYRNRDLLGQDYAQMEARIIVMGGSASTETTLCHWEKTRRLEAINYTKLEDMADVLIAEEMGVVIRWFSTGFGERTLEFVWKEGDELEQKDNWNHQREAWVRRSEFEAIRCMKGVLLNEYAPTTITVDGLATHFAYGTFGALPIARSASLEERIVAGVGQPIVPPKVTFSWAPLLADDPVDLEELQVDGTSQAQFAAFTPTFFGSVIPACRDPPLLY